MMSENRSAQISPKVVVEGPRGDRTGWPGLVFLGLAHNRLAAGHFFPGKIPEIMARCPTCSDRLAAQHFFPGKIPEIMSENKSVQIDPKVVVEGLRGHRTGWPGLVFLWLAYNRLAAPHFFSGKNPGNNGPVSHLSRPASLGGPRGRMQKIE